MFATLLGSLPRPPLPDEASGEALLDACLAVQIEHGLEPVTDGGWPLVATDPVGSWVATAERADRLVKAVIDGPLTAGRPIPDIRHDMLALADAGVDDRGPRARGGLCGRRFGRPGTVRRRASRPDR